MNIISSFSLYNEDDLDCKKTNLNEMNDHFRGNRSLTAMYGLDRYEPSDRGLFLKVSILK